MKKVIIILSVFVCAVSCKETKKEDGKITTDIVNIPATASGKADNSSLPVITFAEENHDFGKITQGEKVSYAFKFKNTGGTDLVISSAQGSCGCTVPQYPKGPIPAGSDGVINVVFNSEGKAGKVQKTVTLLSNANPNTKILTISTEIIVPEDKK